MYAWAETSLPDGEVHWSHVGEDLANEKLTLHAQQNLEDTFTQVLVSHSRSMPYCIVRTCTEHTSAFWLSNYLHVIHVK